MVDVSAVRIGVSLPSRGPAMPGGRMSAPEAARAAEQMGFDSVWVSDHVVMVEGAAAPYPFASDGKITWPEDAPMFDCLVTLAAASAVTERVELGTCVLIAPQRNPIVTAKQAATLDALSGGRLVLGVGVGWLAEEFAALGAPFEGRGKRLDDWIAIFRDCWTGRPAARDYEHWSVPPGVLCYPTPAGGLPILVGGMTPPALRRTGRLAEGWMAFQYTDAVDPEEIAAGRRFIEREAAAAGRPPPLRLAMQAPGPTEPLAERLVELASAGLTDVVVSVDWSSPEKVEESLRMLRRAG